MKPTPTQPNNTPAASPACCAVCAFAAPGDPNPMNLAAGRGLVCRRFPPVLAFVPVNGGQIATATGWPSVQPSQLCGEFDYPLSSPEGLN